MQSVILLFCFCNQETAYEVLRSLVGWEMCIRDRVTLTHPERRDGRRGCSSRSLSAACFDEARASGITSSGEAGVTKGHAALEDRLVHASFLLGVRGNESFRFM